MNAFNNTADNVFKNTTTNVWGSGKNYDAKIGRRLSPKLKLRRPVNTGYNTQPYMASSPSYLPNMAARSDKAIHDDFRVNYDVQIPHAYLEKPYTGFSNPDYKLMKNRKPLSLKPNPIEVAAEEIMASEVMEFPGFWFPILDQDYWQPVGVEVVTEEGWVQHFDNSDWEGLYGISWNAGESRWETSDFAYLGAIGSWFVNYRPTKFRMTFSGTADIDDFYLQDSQLSNIFFEYNYTSLTELTCTFLGYDLDVLRITEGFGVLITNIEFYEAASTNIAWDSTNKQWTWTASSGAIKVHDETNWWNEFFPKKIRFTAVGDGNTQTVYLRDKNSNNIMLENITPPSGVPTEYTFELDWRKVIHSIKGGIDTFGFTTSNTVSVTNIEFFGLVTQTEILKYQGILKKEQSGKIQPAPYLI